LGCIKIHADHICNGSIPPCAFRRFLRLHNHQNFAFAVPSGRLTRGAAFVTQVGSSILDSLHASASSIFFESIKACNIPTAFDRRLRFRGDTLERLIHEEGESEAIGLSDYRRIFVIAMGKAAGPMLEVLLDRMPRRKGLRGICCTKYLPSKRNWRFRYFEGGHPLPNEESFAAARATLALLRKAKKDTLIFFLISGGGSAMFDLPIDESISLQETIEFHSVLLASGAPISDINVLRKHFSAVKGGKLAMAAPDAMKISLLLPDVPLRSLDSLSSGPTSLDPSTLDDVRTILSRFDLESKLPETVTRLLLRKDSSEVRGVSVQRSPLGWMPPRLGFTKPSPAPKAQSGKDECITPPHSIFETLLSSHDLLENARAAAEKAGYIVAEDSSCDDWDYADAARYLLERFHELRKRHARFCLISVGELTVTMDRKPGAGGRNQQFVLECARDLAGHPEERLTVLSAGSDGIDGNTSNAGAIADPTTFKRARAFGFDPEESLRSFDACPLFMALGDSVVTGPTGQNLRDLRLLISESD
jgi:glycerate 2-kinase